MFGIFSCKSSSAILFLLLDIPPRDKEEIKVFDNNKDHVEIKKNTNGLESAISFSMELLSRWSEMLSYVTYFYVLLLHPSSFIVVQYAKHEKVTKQKKITKTKSSL